MLDESQPLRILIVRLGAMGDILHALPAVSALRKALPASRIGWAIEPQWTALLRAQTAGANIARGPRMPVVDRLHTVPAKRWAQHPLLPATLKEIRAVRNELRDERYQLAIDLQGAVRSAWIGRMANTARLIGEEHPREPLARRMFGERVETAGVHVIEQAREVVAAALQMGKELPPSRPVLPVDEEAERWCGEWMGERSIERFVLMNPGAGWGAKCWPADRYAAVAAEFAARGFATIVNAGPGESALAQIVCSVPGERAFAMTGALGQLIALTRRASLFIGGDTGPLHLASALGIPVVGIYGPTDPARNGPYGTRARVLRHSASQRDHSRRSEPESGLLTIHPADVMEAATPLLEPHHSSANAEAQ